MARVVARPWRRRARLAVGPPWLLPGLVVAVLLAACAPAPGQPGSSAAGQQIFTGPKRIVAAITGDPHTLYNKINTNNAIRGIDAVEKLVTAGLATENDTGFLRPQLSDAVPTLENGRWRLNPDGTMETTYRLLPNARWHDGVPFTADDLLFTTQVVRDRELPAFGHIGYLYLDGVDAVDEHTVRARWRQPYIDADRMFAMGAGTFAQPLPRHVLEAPYQENKAGLLDLP